MGIRQLNKIIKKYAPNSIKELNIQELRHKIIAIDSAILMYKYRYAAQDSNDSHIHGFVQRVCFYLKHGILPVFVFDGVPPGAKRQILDKRVKQKIKIESKIQNLIKHKSILCSIDGEKNFSIDSIILETSLEDITDYDTAKTCIEEEINKLSKQVTYVTKTHRQECKYLLKLLGIPVIEANGEAECMCAVMQKNGYADFTFTEDTDALTFGSPKMLKSARKLEKVIEIDLAQILKELNFTMTEFVDFCILCGCDYCPTIPKIGPITALSLIKEHSNIETILNTLDEKYTVPENFDYQTARQLFNHNPMEGIDKLDLRIKSIQEDKLKDFIVGEKGLSENVFNGIVKKYSKSLNEYNKLNRNKTKTEYGTKGVSQSNIMQFFNQSQSQNLKT